MATKKTPTETNNSNFGTLKFDSIKIWVSKNNKTFFQVRCGKNTMWLSADYLESIKKQAS